ncbi:hypothetical protein B0H11DRAFT_1901308 [Mycena galericulata]|nr:hypothetical protein B0H11DRAFT_1901308 [Mycena galericulata]
MFLALYPPLRIRLSLQRVPFVYKLSCEIWIKVFTCCDPLLDDDSYWRWNLKDEVERVRKPYLLELSQVCSGWHYIVMHAAELWSNIVVNTTVWKDSRMLLQLLETSLARSGDHPLSIDVTCGRRADSCCPVVLRLLGRRAMRWKHFRLDCWGPSSFNVILTEARGEFPLLQTLDVDYCGEEWMQCSVFAVAARTPAHRGDSRMHTLTTLETTSPFGYNLRGPFKFPLPSSSTPVGSKRPCLPLLER